MFDAIDGMMLDMLAAVACKDYESLPSGTGSQRGPLVSTRDVVRIQLAMQASGHGQSWIVMVADPSNCRSSRATVLRIARRLKAEDNAV
jgi:hypothetical protein